MTPYQVCCVSLSLSLSLSLYLSPHLNTSQSIKQVPNSSYDNTIQYPPEEDNNSNEAHQIVEEIPKSHEIFTRHIASCLKRDGVRRFAEMLDSMILPLSPSNLARQAHLHGLNIRHFGLVRSYLKMPHAIRVLEIDMVARCLKRVLNTQLRDLMRRMRSLRRRDITKRAIVRVIK